MATVHFPTAEAKSALLEFPFKQFVEGINDNPRIWFNEHYFLLEVGDGVGLKQRISCWVCQDHYRLLECEDDLLSIVFQGLLTDPLFISEAKRMTNAFNDKEYSAFKCKKLLEDEGAFWFDVMYWEDEKEKLKVVKLAIEALGEDEVIDRILHHFLLDPTQSPYCPKAWIKNNSGPVVPNNLEEFIFVYKMEWYIG
jgi:hypothetical protein